MDDGDLSAVVGGSSQSVYEKSRREFEENPERFIRRYLRFRYAVIAVFLFVCLYPILEMIIRIIKGLAKLFFS